MVQLVRDEFRGHGGVSNMWNTKIEASWSESHLIRLISLKKQTPSFRFLEGTKLQNLFIKEIKQRKKNF